MQPDPHEPIKIGPCGISCTICRFSIQGQCECRPGADSRSSDRIAHHHCPVERCAANREIAFCARDCPNFPCLLLEHIIPYRWNRLAAQSVGTRLPRQAESSPAASMPSSQQQSACQDNDTLHILCLGPFRVFRGYAELEDPEWGGGKGPTQKIKALLAFLLCRRAQGARKETLIDLLWPQQTDPKRASSSLHQALFHLRRALEPNLERGTVSSYIRRRGERYYFDPQKPCWIDTDALIDCTQRARALEQRGDPASAIEYWARATELYGGRFMAGIDSEYTRSEYYDWCASASHRFEQLFLAATLKVARHHLTTGHHTLAIVHAREALRVEPALESAHRLIVECMMDTGQWEQALAQYRVWEAALAFHQDHEPSTKMERLYQQILERTASA